MTVARLAYVNARVRARRTRLLGRNGLAAMAATDTPSSLVAGWRDADPDADGGEPLPAIYARLIDAYAFALRAAPTAAAVVLPLLRLHEVENLKLPWRAIARERTDRAWTASWRPLGRLGTLDPDACGRATTLRTLTSLLATTPYGGIADAMLRAHGQDVGAAELALDTWASRQLARAADALAPGENAARELLRLVVIERDAAAALRGGTPPPASRSAIRARQRIARRRAFQRTPYCLAPLVAYLLACEEEARALVSVAEMRSRRIDAAGVRRVLETVM